MLKNIFVFGDSIAHGAWDDEMGGWVNRLRVFVMGKAIADSWNDVYELGVNGSTSENVLNRMEFELFQRTIPEQGDILIIAVGINDCVFLKDQDSNLITASQFKENLQYITALAKKYSEKIVFAGLIPVNEKEANPRDCIVCYGNKYINEYNNIIKSVCEKNNLIFIDVLEEFQKIDYKKLLDEDGLHPNPSGHQKIFEVVRDSLVKNKLIKS